MHASAHTNCPTGHKHHLCHSFLHHLLALSHVLTWPMTHSNTSPVLQAVSTKGNIHHHLMVTSRDMSLPPVHPSGRYKIDSTSEWRWRPSFCWSSLEWHTCLSSSTHKRHGISENGHTVWKCTLTSWNNVSIDGSAYSRPLCFSATRAFTLDRSASIRRVHVGNQVWVVELEEETLRMPKLSISCVDGAYTSVSSVVTESWFLSGQEGTQGALSKEQHVYLPCS